MILQRQQYVILFVGVALLTLIAGAVAQTESAGQQLRVGTKVAPPFVIRTDDGSWSGISIDLWRDIASELELDYRIEERDLPGLFSGLEHDSLDVVVGATTVTAEREALIDFTHPFYSTGLSIATSTAGQGNWRGALGRLLSLQFFRVVGLLMLLLLAVGVLVWVFERKRNPEQFGGRPLAGIGHGFWWSAVTMTTVGYGDIAPRSVAGRLVGLVWMFVAVIIISSFTAAITSTLTVSSLESRIRGPKDLYGVRVGSVPGSTSETWLRDNRIAFDSVSSPFAGLEKVASGELDAVVYDAPILKYLVNEQFQGRLQVLPGSFARQDYGIGLQEGSSLREPVNLALLRITRSPQWQELLNHYLGD